MTKEYLAHLLQVTDRRAVDDLFRSAGQEPVVLPTHRTPAGITLTPDELSTFRRLVASRESLPRYPPDVFHVRFAPAESPLDTAQRQIARLQTENDQLREEARQVASERARLQADRTVLEGVLLEVASRETHMDALEAENARLRAENKEIESLRARAAKAEADLARQTETLSDFAALRQGEEAERQRVNEELNALLPVVELLTTEAKRHQAREPGGDAPVDLLAELNLLVKEAGAYEGSVVLEKLARSRADELKEKLVDELSWRAVAEAELERLQAIEAKWREVEPELPRLRQAEADAATWQGPAFLWKQYQQWEAGVKERFPLRAALYKRQLLGGTGAYPQKVHEWAMLFSYNGKRNYAMLEEGLDFPARSVVKDDCRRDRERLALEALFSTRTMA